MRASPAATEDVPVETRASPAVLVAVAGAIASTVVFDPWGFRPFTVLRWPVLAACLLVAGALVAGARAPASPRWLRVTGWAFLGWTTVATVLSVDPLHAWIGHPRRHLGLAGWVVCAVGFGVGARLRGDGARRLVGRAMAVAAAVTGIGVPVELAGVDPAGVAFAGPRAGGLFGQPAYLGAAGVLLAPVSLALARRGGDPSRAWRWVGGLGAVGATFAVLASQARGAWLGLAVCTAVMWPVLAPAGRARRHNAITVAGVVAVAAVLLVSPLGTRVRATFDPADGTTRGRADEWRVAVAAVVERPVAGAGPEGYRVVAPAHIDADYTRRYGRDEVVDRAHDGVLDVAVSAGVPAAVAYTLMLGGVTVLMWRARRDPRPLVVGAAAAVAGFVAQQLVLFPIAELDPLVWLLAGLVLAARAPSAGPPRRTRSTVAAAAVMIGAALAAGAAGAADAMADRSLAAATRELRVERHDRARDAADTATRWRQDSIDTWYASASIVARGPTILDVDAGIDRAEEGLRWSPGDPALADLRERLLAQRALRSTLPDDIDRALAASRARIAADPANPVHHRLLGTIAAVAGERDAAAAALDRALALDPGDTAAARARAALDHHAARPGDGDGT